MRAPRVKSNPAITDVPAPVKVRPRFPVWLMAVLLVLVTIALYWPATRSDFVNYDDPVYVTANPHVQGGLTWEGVKWAFGNPVSRNWHPLTVLSHMLDCQLFGLNPWGHHLTNVLLHALNTVLVFLLLRRMTGAPWRSLLVAALFALHPLRVESVAWVAERKDVLSGCFGLLALIVYARYAQIAVEHRASEASEDPAVHGLAHGPRLSTISPCFLRPGLDEQADAGDVAVRDVAAGLLAAWSGFKLGTVGLSALGDGEDPVLCPRGGGERRDLRGAEARRRCDGG